MSCKEALNKKVQKINYGKNLKILKMTILKFKQKNTPKTPINKKIKKSKSHKWRPQIKK